MVNFKISIAQIKKIRYLKNTIKKNSLYFNYKVKLDRVGSRSNLSCHIITIPGWQPSASGGAFFS